MTTVGSLMSKVPSSAYFSYWGGNDYVSWLLPSFKSERVSVFIQNFSSVQSLKETYLWLKFRYHTCTFIESYEFSDEVLSLPFLAYHAGKVLPK